MMARYAIERAVIERLFGRRDEERALLAQSIELARPSPMSVLLACALAESAHTAIAEQMKVMPATLRFDHLYGRKLVGLLRNKFNKDR